MTRHTPQSEARHDQAVDLLRENGQGESTPRVVVVACKVLEDEINHYAAQCPNVVDVVWLEQGLHNDPPRLRVELQATVSQIEDQYPDVDAIVLGYGLCSRGTEEVVTQRMQLVMARAHDCITLLLGSKERYAEYVRENPGSYWYSPGWNRCHIPPGPERYQKLRQSYVDTYGEDNADYLMEVEQAWFSSYTRAAYVDLTVGVTDEDLSYTQACADWLGWDYDRQVGDPALLRDLMAGPWDDDRFLVLEPGHAFELSGDDQVLRAKRHEA